MTPPTWREEPRHVLCGSISAIRHAAGRFSDWGGSNLRVPGAQSTLLGFLRWLAIGLLAQQFPQIRCSKWLAQWWALTGSNRSPSGSNQESSHRCPLIRHFIRKPSVSYRPSFRRSAIGHVGRARRLGLIADLGDDASVELWRTLRWICSRTAPRPPERCRLSC